MKKSNSVFKRIITLAIALVCALGVFSGCSIIKTNVEEDSNLPVAIIQIEDEIAPTNIYKKDMYSAYVSYGYYYVNNYGYSLKDTYQLILDNLEQNAVVEQFAKMELVKLYEEIQTKATLNDFEEYFKNNAGFAQDSSVLTYNSDIDKFLTSYQIAEATYNVKLSINSLIDTFVEQEEEEEKEKESVSLTARENHFVEEEEEELTEWELKTDKATSDEIKIVAKKLNVTEQDIKNVLGEEPYTYDLNMHLYNNFNFDVSTKERQRAFNLAINGYRNLGIISKNEYHNSQNALDYEYFKKQLATEKAQKLVLFYQSSLEDAVKSELTNEMLYQDYVDTYNTQEAKFKYDYKAYESAMESATEDAPIVYHPYSGYGYVSNLLLGFSDEQTAELTLFKGQKGITAAEVNTFRNNLAKTILVGDQRISWATSGLGNYEEATSKYVFKDEYILTKDVTLKNLLSSFIGTVENPKSSTDEDENGLEKTTWTVTNGIATSIKYNDFYNNYLVASNQGFASDITTVTYNVENNSGIGTLTDYNDDYMRDLIYAFSTDPGSLTSKNGYIYSPYSSATTYVKEFAAAAKALVEGGVGSYTLVVTDYGVHVMVCLKTISSTSEKIGADFVAYLNGEANSLTQEQKDFVDNFKKVKQDSLVSSYVSEKANTFVSKYLEKDSPEYATVFFTKNYEDLMK